MFLTLYEQRFGRASSVHFQALIMKKGSSVTINEAPLVTVISSFKIPSIN